MGKNLTPQIRFQGFNEPWKSSNLGEISAVKTGPFGSALHADDYVSEGHPIITTEHFKDGNIPHSKEDIPQVSEEDYKRLSAYILNEDDLVFSRVGSVDINALTESCHSGWLFSSRVLRVRPIDIYADYLHYFLSTHSAKKDIINRAVGQTMPSINTTILKETSVSFPPKRTEQQKVAYILRNTTKLLAVKSLELEKLENVKKACMEQMFPREGETTPQLRFKGFKDNWKSYNLNDLVLRIGTGLNPRNNFTLNSGGSNYYITIKNILHGSISLDESCDLVDDEALKIIQQRSDLRTGDILFSSIGRVGDCYLVKETPKNWNINESVFTLRPKQDIIFPLYLMHAIHTDSVLKQILDNVTGSTFKSIKISDLKGISIPVPTIDEQIKIADFIDSYYKLIAAKRQEIEKLHNIKQALLDKMFV